MKAPSQGLASYADMSHILRFALQRGYVLMVSGFFDESYGDGLFVFGGYLFSKSGVIKFERAWKAMLKKHKLPYFRMSSCAHGNGVFEGMSKDRRAEVARNAINLIKAHAMTGLYVVIDEQTLKQVNLEFPLIGSDSYRLCVYLCMMCMRKTVNEKTKGQPIAMVFEAGHPSDGATGEMLGKMLSNDGLGSKYNVASYIFAKKEQSVCCQAADLLAWQVRKHYADKPSGKAMRKDFDSLLELDHISSDLDKQTISRVKSSWDKWLASRIPAPNPV